MYFVAFFPEPENDLACIAIDWRHPIDLPTPLAYVTLIDAECIEPLERNQQVTTPGRSSGPLRPFHRSPVMNLD
jgi:hypothetical protein